MVHMWPEEAKAEATEQSHVRYVQEENKKLRSELDHVRRELRHANQRLTQTMNVVHSYRQVLEDLSTHFARMEQSVACAQTERGYNL